MRRFQRGAPTRALLKLLRAKKKELTLYDSGHRLPVEYTDAAFRWLGDALK